MSAYLCSECNDRAFIESLPVLRSHRAASEALEQRVTLLVEALRNLSVGRGYDCWCDPTGDGPHMPRCAAARNALGITGDGA